MLVFAISAIASIASIVSLLPELATNYCLPLISAILYRVDCIVNIFRALIILLDLNIWFAEPFNSQGAPLDMEHHVFVSS